MKIYFCWWILDFLHFDKIISYAVILRIGGVNFRCLLFIVISVSSVCMFIVLWHVFHNWAYWARGKLSGEPGHVHFGVCASPLCGVPGRYEYIWSLCWAGWRAGTGFLSFLALFWRVFAWLNSGGGGGSVRFFLFVFLFAMAGRYDWNCEWVLYLNFHFLQFFC